MKPEQKAVILEYAQELQHNDKPWQEFEWAAKEATFYWRPCSSSFYPLVHHDSGNWAFRRKPRTITVTMPVPKSIVPTAICNTFICIELKTVAERDTALAAIREAIGNE